jgi:hypothetical protein
MLTLILTLLLIVVGYGLSFAIASRKGGPVRALLAYVAGLLGVILVTAVATLFEAGSRMEGAEFAPLVAFIAPAIGVLNGRWKSRRGQAAKSS